LFKLWRKKNTTASQTKKFPQWTELEKEPQVARPRINVRRKTICLFKYASGLWDIYGQGAIRRSKLDLCLSVVVITLSLLWNA